MTELILIFIVMAALVINERTRHKDVDPPDDDPPIGIGGNP